jgi:glutamyl-Q tRNA(Asp) synthetase
MPSTHPPASRPTLRFAPSPNGPLHWGHALSALATATAARALRGRFLLRIEDIDIGRSRPQFIDGIVRDCAWLGLAWEEPVLRQSARFPLYRAAADRLAALGLLYPCFATRAEIEAATPADGPRDPEGAPLYPGLWRNRAQADIDAARARGLPQALRLDMGQAIACARSRASTWPLTFSEGLGLLAEAVEAHLPALPAHPMLAPGGPLRQQLAASLTAPARLVTADPARWGDVVLVRKDTPTSYHLSVVVDDAAQGVTHVTRGADLYAATDLHRLLQVLLDLPAPVYAHHGLITDASGRKLSKSAGEVGLRG